MVINSNSENQTRNIGVKLGRLLKPGDIIALAGEPGVGKTIIAKGIAEALSVSPEKVTSPTFTLFNIYEGNKLLYHFDWYRVKSPEEIEIAGFLEYLYSDAISVIEWYNSKLLELPNCIEINIEFKNENERIITLPDYFQNKLS